MKNGARRLILAPHERIVLENRFTGGKSVRGPGIILFPFNCIFFKKGFIPGLHKRRAVILISVDSLNLFSAGVVIDFKKGGTAKLVNPKVFFKPKGSIEDEFRESILKMVYGLSNWVDFLISSIEDGLRNALSSLTVEEAIDLNNRHDWWVLVQKIDPNLKIQLESYGIEVVKITIDDFDWSEEVVEKRREVFVSERDAVAEKIKEKIAKITGRQEGEKIKEAIRIIYDYLIQKGFSPEDAKEIAKEFIRLNLVLRNGNYNETQFSLPQLESIINFFKK